MKDMCDVREEEKEGEARSKIISTNAQNESQYTRVCIFPHFPYLLHLKIVVDYDDNSKLKFSPND